ncbi:MAG: YbaB/EbfC family nucleoid-associated protein [bacterium]|nr:YbaB/EbfC family nucleoid-associated protein [bacterium]
MNQVMKQAQEMGGKLKRLQEELKHRSVDVTVGGGMVEATVNGAMELVNLRIDPQAVDPRDVEMLQDLIRAAVNQGMVRAKEMMQQEMQQLTGMPPGMLDGVLPGMGGGE